jgi:alkylated DNA repair dioxygenase AlkB
MSGGQSVQALGSRSLMIGRQLGLFDALSPGVDSSFSDVRHIDLDATSWIEHVPGWMHGSEQLFDELLETAPWEQRERWMYTRQVAEPRLTAQYNDISLAPQPMLHTVAAALSSHYGVCYRSLWINLYRDGHDSTAWHGDQIGHTEEESIVPVLSLGATRRFLIRASEGGRSLSFRPGAGDLIVMGGRCQRDWRHCVPKQLTPASSRISINFSTGRR